MATDRAETMLATELAVIDELWGPALAGAHATTIRKLPDRALAAIGHRLGRRRSTQIDSARRTLAARSPHLVRHAPGSLAGPAGLLEELWDDESRLRRLLVSEPGTVNAADVARLAAHPSPAVRAAAARCWAATDEVAVSILASIEDRDPNRVAVALAARADGSEQSTEEPTDGPYRFGVDAAAVFASSGIGGIRRAVAGRDDLDSVALGALIVAELARTDPDPQVLACALRNSARVPGAFGSDVHDAITGPAAQALIGTLPMAAYLQRSDITAEIVDRLDPARFAAQIVACRAASAAALRAAAAVGGPVKLGRSLVAHPNTPTDVLVAIVNARADRTFASFRMLAKRRLGVWEPYRSISVLRVSTPDLADPERAALLRWVSRALAPGAAATFAALVRSAPPDALLGQVVDLANRTAVAAPSAA